MALGEGYSAIAAEGSTLITQYRPAKGVVGTIVGRLMGGADTEVVVALDSATGARSGSTGTRRPCLRA
jgi:hypothetical protein